MNELNYASLEASKKLHDAGIILETETVWRKARLGHRYLTRKALYHRTTDIPAPSMAEVWRELPDSTCINKDGDYTKCWVDSNMSLKVFQNENPADALIDLLIWKEKP
jgi:hypothetical protein